VAFGLVCVCCGTGLGLAIVKHVLNRHHGALVIESEVGKGSTFNVYLPVYDDVAPQPSETKKEKAQ
jgi:two-component system phosphate regulon sensor histidine kinase PhoR